MKKNTGYFVVVYPTNSPARIYGCGNRHEPDVLGFIELQGFESYREAARARNELAHLHEVRILEYTMYIVPNLEEILDLPEHETSIFITRTQLASGAETLLWGTSRGPRPYKLLTANGFKGFPSLLDDGSCSKAAQAYQVKHPDTEIEYASWDAKFI